MYNLEETKIQLVNALKVIHEERNIPYDDSSKKLIDEFVDEGAFDIFMEKLNLKVNKKSEQQATEQFKDKIPAGFPSIENFLEFSMSANTQVWAGAVRYIREQVKDPKDKHSYISNTFLNVFFRNGGSSLRELATNQKFHLTAVAVAYYLSENIRKLDKNDSIRVETGYKFCEMVEFPKVKSDHDEAPAHTVRALTAALGDKEFLVMFTICPEQVYESLLEELDK